MPSSPDKIIQAIQLLKELDDLKNGGNTDLISYYQEKLHELGVLPEIEVMKQSTKNWNAQLQFYLPQQACDVYGPHAPPSKILLCKYCL